MMKIKAKSYVFIFFLLAPSLSADTVYFRSNEVGIAFEPIDRYRQKEFEYVLTLHRSDNKETRILLRKGKEWKRWVTHFNAQGKKTEEIDYEGGVLVSHGIFDGKGRLILERLYEKGNLTLKKTYSYSVRGIDFVDVLDAADVRLYTDEYELSPAGRLRSMRRVYPDNSVAVIHYTYGEGKLVGEWEYRDGRIFETTYNADGRALHREEWEKDTLVGLTEYSYHPQSGALEKEIWKNPAAGTKTERTYDADGNMIAEKTTDASGAAADISYTYDGAGRKKTMRRKSDIGIEEWRYFYTEAGALAREEYFRRGLLEMRTVYTDADHVYEEILREEVVIIRIYYEKQRKIKEEFIQDGGVVRTKEY